MPDIFCTNSYHLPLNQRKALPFLEASPKEGFAAHMLRGTEVLDMAMLMSTTPIQSRLHLSATKEDKAFDD